jgi:hypothetical protein
MLAYIRFYGNSQITNDLDAVLDDMTAVICGETDVNNLSGQVKIADSFILTTYSASPWELYDDVDGDHKQLRCQQSDSGEYKHIGFHETGIVSLSAFSFSLMDDWDNVLHTGTNIYTPPASFNTIGTNHQQTDLGYWIYADEFTIYILPIYYSGQIGSISPGTAYGSLMISEVSRDHPSLKIGDMPNWFIGHGAAVIGGSTLKDYKTYFGKGRDYLGNVVTPLTSFGGVVSRGSHRYNYENYITTIQGASCKTEITDTYKHYAAEHLVVQSSGADIPTYVNSGSYVGSISERCDIWHVAIGSHPLFSIMLFRDKKYIVMRGAHTTFSSDANLGTKFIVPYG